MRSSFSRKRVQLLIAALGVVLGSVVLSSSAAGSGRGTGPITVNPGQAAAVLKSMGISIPAQSCLARPFDADCPYVSKIVIQPPVVTSDPSAWVPFGPNPIAGSTPPGSASPLHQRAFSARVPNRSHEYNGTGCWAHATTPTVTSTASSTAQNVCNESGVTDQETWGQISRFQNNTWTTMNDCYTNSPTDGWQSCTSTYDCYHPTVAYRYAGFANAYAVIYGVGYYGSNQSATYYSTCS